MSFGKTLSSNVKIGRNSPIFEQCWHRFIGLTFLSSIMLLSVSVVSGQDFPGNDDLDQAFDKKIKAQTTRDFEEVVKLCKSAIEQGLDDEGIVQARQLAATASLDHAEQLARRIFAQTPPDRRWQKFRTEALQQLEQATEFQPSMVAAYLMMARLNLLPNGNIEAARAAIEKAVENAGDDREQLSSALFYRASLNEDKEAQLADINQALKINPDNLEALKFRAVYFLNEKETEKGLVDINQWLGSENVKPDDFLASVLLLRAMGTSFDDNLQQEALKIIERGMALAPEDPRFLEQRTEIYVIRQELDLAIADVSKLIEMEVANLQGRKLGYLLLRGGMYSSQEKYEEALADYGEILNDNPNSLPAIEARASTLAAKGDFAGSLKDFKKIQRQMGTPNPVLMRQIGMLHNANDEPSEAVEVYNELLEILAEEKFSDRPEEVKREIERERQSTWRARGDAFLSLGKHQEAIGDFNKVLEIQQSIQEFAKQDSNSEIPDDEHTLNNLAWVLSTSPVDELRDGKRAIELATKAAEATEFKEAYILSTLASAYAESGDFENALKWIEKAIEINSESRAQKQTERNLEQKDSLQNELEHYQRKEPFRELQNVEQKKAEKEDEKNDAKPPEEDQKKNEDENSDKDDSSNNGSISHSN